MHACIHYTYHIYTHVHPSYIHKRAGSWPLAAAPIFNWRWAAAFAAELGLAAALAAMLALAAALTAVFAAAIAAFAAFAAAALTRAGELALGRAGGLTSS